MAAENFQAVYRHGKEDGVGGDKEVKERDLRCKCGKVFAVAFVSILKLHEHSTTPMEQHALSRRALACSCDRGGALE